MGEKISPSTSVLQALRRKIFLGRRKTETSETTTYGTKSPECELTLKSVSVRKYPWISRTKISETFLSFSLSIPLYLLESLLFPIPFTLRISFSPRDLAKKIAKSEIEEIGRRQFSLREIAITRQRFQYNFFPHRF